MVLDVSLASLVNTKDRYYVKWLILIMQSIASLDIQLNKKNMAQTYTKAT